MTTPLAPPRAAIQLDGLWVPIITPFTADGSVDETSLRQLAEGLLAEGAEGLVALGTTGEPATLAADERRRVVEICDAVCVGARRPLMVGAGTNSTAGTIEEIKLLTDGTATAAALIVVPYYTRPSEAAIVEHFGLVADASDVPVVMYNIPYRTGRGLGAAALLEAGRHKNIIGLKQSVAALDLDTLELLAHADRQFQVLAGDDAFVVPSVLMGAAGAIAAAAHVCTPVFVEMIAAARSGDAVRAAELAQILLPVVTAGFGEPNPAVWKGALAHDRRIRSASVRRPLTAASTASVQRLTSAIEQVRLFAE